MTNQTAEYISQRIAIYARLWVVKFKIKKASREYQEDKGNGEELRQLMAEEIELLKQLYRINALIND